MPGRAGHMNAPVSWSALQKQSAGNGGGGGGGDKGGEEGDKEDKFAAFKGRANKLR